MYEKKNTNVIWYMIIGVVVVTLLMLGLLALLLKSGGDEEEGSTAAGTTAVTETKKTEEKMTEVKTEGGKTEEKKTEAKKTEAKKTEGKKAETAVTSKLTFRDAGKKNQHYEKHGAEMGFADADAYEAAANEVVSDPVSLHKTEKEDGDDVYYREKDNAFVVVSTDGYIRTFFYPSGGKAYYDKQ